MNKLKLLTKKLVRAVVMAAIIVAIAIAFYIGSTLFSEDAEKQKTDIESKYRTDKALEQDLRRQLETSDEAAKRFLVLQKTRKSDAYSGTLEALIEYLKGEKLRYKFEPFNMGKPQKATLTTKEQLKNLSNFNIEYRPIQFKISAVSDLHVFSFIEELQANVPGIVRVDGLSLKRNQDMNEGQINQLEGGARLITVDATIDLTWVTVEPKDQGKPTANSDSATVTTGGTP